MPDFGNAISRFLDDKALNPHGICLLWRPELIWTHAVSDLLIGLAYFSIPLAMGVFLYHRRDVRFGWAIWMFVLFIMLCGVTHLMMIWTLWNPDYGVEALIKAATAVASIVTAVALWPLLPKAIAIPSTSALEARIRERDEALAELQAAMATMMEMKEHQERQSQLLDQVNISEARLRSVFENAAVGIARVDLDGVFLELNDRFAEIAGWSREELLGGGFQRITHPEDLDHDLAHLDALLRGEVDRYTIEKRYLPKAGGVVWVRLTVSLARRSSGAPDHFVSIIEDITAERAGAEARELLMREVDHRARNALTVVQSVVRLTDAQDPERFKNTVIGRVDALGRAQSALSKTNWQGADLRDVLADELSALSDPDRCSFEGPPVHLPPEHVQPVSMILHELATNAVKHGALSAADGRLEVEWARNGSDGWRLTWCERGGPVVSPPDHQGFGSRLLRRLAKEIGGEIAFDWTAVGLCAVLHSAGRPNETSHPFIGATATLQARMSAYPRKGA